MERLLRKREQRGLTYRELSEESGIPIPTLSWWSRRLKGERPPGGSAQGCELVAIEVVDDEPEGSADAIEIIVGDRLKLLVPPSASQVHLQRVLRAVVSC